MGKSLRRHKKTRVKAVIHKKDVSKRKPLPVLLPGAVQPVGDEWSVESTLRRNYAAAGLAADPNAAVAAADSGAGPSAAGARPRRRATAAAAAPAEPFLESTGRASAATTLATDDELRAALGLVRSTGKAAPKRLSSHQTAIVDSLIAAHGADVGAMARDLKRNALQHTPATLRAMLASHAAYPALAARGGMRGFRAPIKRL